MSWEFINIILLLAAIQGLSLTLLILHKHGKLYANRFLGAMLFFYSIILLNIVLEELGYFFKYPFLLFIQFGLPFFIGPLHYFYAKYLTHSLVIFKKTDWLHFLPFVLFELYLSYNYFKPNSEILSLLRNIDVEGLPLLDIIFNWAIIIQGLTYMLMTLLILKRYSQKIKFVFSTIEKIKLNWLRNITFLTIFVIINFLVENIFYLGGINLSNFFNYTSLLAAVSVYAMGYLGFFKSEIFAQPEIALAISQSSRFGTKDTLVDDSHRSKKYEKSGLSPNRAKMYLNHLIKLMEQERPYIDSNLTLTQLANKLSISPHNLSEVINTQLNQNFFDFINQYRIEEAKKYLIDPQKQHLKILSIAYDAGFNSKSSFNTIFKKYTNMTPSEFRDKFLQEDV